MSTLAPVIAVASFGAYCAISNPSYPGGGQVAADGGHSICTIVMSGHPSHSCLDHL